MAKATYQAIVARLQAQGYETSRLVRTLQVADGESSAPPLGEVEQALTSRHARPMPSEAPVTTAQGP